MSSEQLDYRTRLATGANTHPDPHHHLHAGTTGDMPAEQQEYLSCMQHIVPRTEPHTCANTRLDTHTPQAPPSTCPRSSCAAPSSAGPTRTRSERTWPTHLPWTVGWHADRQVLVCINYVCACGQACQDERWHAGAVDGGLGRGLTVTLSRSGCVCDGCRWRCTGRWDLAYTGHTCSGRWVGAWVNGRSVDCAHGRGAHAMHTLQGHHT